ncbi:MAG TPA: RimK/LysX family protein [Candidatus Saccharimonadales bacterium]|nr:RimK/LysX family protein [Candidatus Saccharimonadales bacterium]
MSDRLTLGGLEEVKIVDFDAVVLAKVDTGAFSGALHCSDIKVERHDDKATLSFVPLETGQVFKTHDFEEIIVRSAHGHEQVRYIVPLELEVQGKTYRTEVGLTDRTAMKRDMLLGRRFCLETNALVDVTLTRDIDDEAERIEL